MFSTVHRNKIYFVVIGLFLFYLLVIPQIINRITPCLARIPGYTYTHEECVVTLVLDRFMLLALLGFVAANLYIFFAVHPRSFKKITALAITLALLIIFSYYQYIPVSERAVKSAPIILFDPAK